MAVGEYTVRSEIDIERSMEDVWALVSDPENDPRWCQLVPEVSVTGQGVDGQPRYRFTQSFGPVRRTGSGEVISTVSPTELRGIANVMGGVFRYEYQLEPADGRTRFVHINRVRWSGPMRLMHPVQKRMTQRIMDRQLQALKKIMEEGSE